MAIDSKYIIESQGKKFVLYAGLLNEAHVRGLQSIRTQLIQAPTDVNMGTAIAWAEVTMKDGTVFTGIGDADPGNVNQQIKSHLIRMAETRAKARGLRDALNIAEVSLEEVTGSEARSVRSSSRTRQQSAPAVTAAAPGQVALASEPQLRAIYAVAGVVWPKNQKAVETTCLERYHVVPNELGREQASEFIDFLKAEAAKKPQPAVTQEQPIPGEVSAADLIGNEPPGLEFFDQPPVPESTPKPSTAQRPASVVSPTAVYAEAKRRGYAVPGGVYRALGIADAVGLAGLGWENALATLPKTPPAGCSVKDMKGK